MSSSVSICSNALIQLGAQPISSFTDNNDNATRCGALWGQTRDGVLRSHPWNTCIKRVALSPSTTAPVYGFSFAFDKPGDLLRLLEVDSLYDHKVESTQILGDENPLYIKYVYRNEDVASYDALLIEALTWAMMSKLAYPVTKSTTKSTEVNAIYVQYLKIARSVDGMEDTPDAIGESQLLRARRR